MTLAITNKEKKHYVQQIYHYQQQNSLLLTKCVLQDVQTKIKALIPNVTCPKYIKYIKT